MKEKIGIFGMGISGMAAKKFFEDLGHEVICGDDIKTEGMTHILHEKWKKIDKLILSPGIPFQHKPHDIVKLCLTHNISISCDIEEFISHSRKKCDAKILGITGTNGKSTTASLIDYVIQENYEKGKNFLAGNIGIPILSLPKITKNDLTTIEVSSFQLDLMSREKFNISILLNISKDHLNRYENFQQYINSKKKIFQNQKDGDVAIIGIDDEICSNIYNSMDKTKNIIAISTSKILKQGISIIENSIFIDGKKIIVENFPNLPGMHNKQNIAATIAACLELGINIKNIIESIKKFEPLEHRSEKFLTINNVEFINDSKATNIDAACKSIDAFSNIYLIIGGVSKNDDIKEIAKHKDNIRKAYLIGDSANEFAELFQELNIDFNITKTLENSCSIAFRDATKLTNINSTILLAPACASFDQFKNFQERGRKFKDFCLALPR